MPLSWQGRACTWGALVSDNRGLECEEHRGPALGRGVSSLPLSMPSWQTLSLGRGPNQAHKLRGLALACHTDLWCPVKRGNSVGAERNQTGVQEGTQNRPPPSISCVPGMAPGLSSESRWLSGSKPKRQAGLQCGPVGGGCGGQSPGPSIRWSLRIC